MQKVSCHWPVHCSLPFCVFCAFSRLIAGLRDNLGRLEKEETNSPRRNAKSTKRKGNRAKVCAEPVGCKKSLATGRFTAPSLFSFFVPLRRQAQGRATN